MADLSLVLVTPEQTLFDRSAASVRVPLFDGSAGIYPGRAPLVGRLGYGELKLNEPNGNTESWFIEGGFVQVKGGQVSVLTNAAVPVSELSRATALEELEKARAEKPGSAEEQEARAGRLERARRMVSLATVD